MLVRFLVVSRFYGLTKTAQSSPSEFFCYTHFSNTAAVLQQLNHYDKIFHLGFLSVKQKLKNTGKKMKVKPIRLNQ